MHIGIDISQLAYEGTGVARYTKGIVETSLAHHESGDEWTYFFSGFRKQLDPTIEDKIIKSGSKLIKFPLSPRMLSILWNDLHVLSADKLTGKLDWFITSDWTEPPVSGNKATIVHDLVFKKYPDTVHRSIKSTHEKRLRRVAAESNLIFCDSIATRDDLINEYSIAKNKTIINYPGVKLTKPSEDHIEKIRNKYNLIKPFVLSVGKIEPRKNLNKLIETFESIEAEVELIIVGPDGWGNIDNSKIDNHRIRLLGYVPDEELYALYASAICFVFPSLYEGFGYPAVEAMSLGCPTALSRTSSLIEIGGDASIFFNPEKVDEN